jgi:hypothetical protein
MKREIEPKVSRKKDLSSKNNTAPRGLNRKGKS